MQGHGICESMGGDGMALARPAAMPKRITQNMEETCSLAKKRKGKAKQSSTLRREVLSISIQLQITYSRDGDACGCCDQDFRVDHVSLGPRGMRWFKSGCSDWKTMPPLDTSCQTISPTQCHHDCRRHTSHILYARPYTQRLASHQGQVQGCSRS